MSIPLTDTFSDKTYSYDPNGNLIQTVSGTTKVAYVWDAANRLVATERFTGTTRTGPSAEAAAANEAIAPAVAQANQRSIEESVTADPPKTDRMGKSRTAM